MKKLFDICRKRNMKKSPSKFRLGPKVVYGGTVLEATKLVGDRKKTVFISFTQERLEAFLNFPSPSCKKDIQSICGAAAQLKRWTPGLKTESASLQKFCGANVPFFWKEEVQEELDRMKKAMMEHVKLSHLYMTKNMVV